MLYCTSQPSRWLWPLVFTGVMCHTVHSPHLCYVGIQVLLFLWISWFATRIEKGNCQRLQRKVRWFAWYELTKSLAAEAGSRWEHKAARDEHAAEVVHHNPLVCARREDLEGSGVYDEGHSPHSSRRLELSSLTRRCRPTLPLSQAGPQPARLARPKTFQPGQLDAGSQCLTRRPHPALPPR